MSLKLVVVFFSTHYKYSKVRDVSFSEVTAVNPGLERKAFTASCQLGRKKMSHLLILFIAAGTFQLLP